MRGTYGENRSEALEPLNKMRSVKAEAKVWSPRMPAALVNGVKGGERFGLIDKARHPKTLMKAWEAARRNKSAAWDRQGQSGGLRGETGY
jgi:hypothetical protein